MRRRRLNQNTPGPRCLAAIAMRDLLPLALMRMAGWLPGQATLIARSVLQESFPVITSWARELTLLWAVLDSPSDPIGPMDRALTPTETMSTFVHVHGSFWFNDCCNLTEEIVDRSLVSEHTTETGVLETISICSRVQRTGRRCDAGRLGDTTQEFVLYEQIVEEFSGIEDFRVKEQILRILTNKGISQSELGEHSKANRDFQYPRGAIQKSRCTAFRGMAGKRLILSRIRILEDYDRTKKRELTFSNCRQATNPAIPLFQTGSQQCESSWPSSKLIHEPSRMLSSIQSVSLGCDAIIVTRRWISRLPKAAVSDGGCMTVYVLGAGASAHAGYPLAAALGVALDSWVEEARPSDHKYRVQFTQLKEAYGVLSDFEAVLTDLMTRAPGSIASKLPTVVRPYLLTDVQGAIRDYFDAIRLQPAPLYDLLARNHIHEGDVVITFNYDLGIERSLRLPGLWEITDGYGLTISKGANASRVKVLKLHGSTNWRALLFDGNAGFGRADNSLGERPVLFFRPDLEYLGYGEFMDPRCAGLSQAASTSSIIMPALPKRFYFETSFGREWEPFWDHLWHSAAKALQATNEVIIIGYSLPAADQRARELLLAGAKKNANLTICCGNATSGIEEQFRKEGFSRIHRVPQPTFEGWLAYASVNEVG